VGLHDAIRVAIPTLVNFLIDGDLHVRLEVASALADLAEHGES
jgi:hypothetical protein